MAKASLQSHLAKIHWLPSVCISGRQVCLVLPSLRLLRPSSFNNSSNLRTSERSSIRRKELNLLWVNSSAARRRRPARAAKIVSRQPVEPCLLWPVEMMRPVREIPSLLSAWVSTLIPNGESRCQQRRLLLVPQLWVRKILIVESSASMKYLFSVFQSVAKVKNIYFFF